MERRRMRRRSGSLYFFVGVAALATVSTAKASPWARGDDELFLSTKVAYFLAKASSPLPGAIDPSRFERFDTDTYAEFGLSRHTTLGGKVVYGSSTYYDGFISSAASGFSEIEAFAQHEVLRTESHALSFRLAAAAPTRLDTGVRPGLRNDGADIDARALYGRNLTLKPFKTYATVEAAYRRRFGDAADQMRADFLFGAEPFRNALVLMEVLATKSLRNERPSGADYDVVKIQPSIVWRFSRRWSVQVGVTHEAAGRNLLLGDAYFVGFWTQF